MEYGKFVAIEYTNISGVMFIIWLKASRTPSKILVTFQEFLLELMLISMFLTGAGVLDDRMDGLRMNCGSSV